MKEDDYSKYVRFDHAAAQLPITPPAIPPSLTEQARQQAWDIAHRYVEGEDDVGRRRRCMEAVEGLCDGVRTRAATAALERAAQWQPIETAPDATYPTHWMLLPQSPTIAAIGDDKEEQR